MIDPGVWARRRDKPALEAAVTTELPQIMDYLEAQVPAHGHIFGGISIADISIVPYFANLNWGARRTERRTLAESGCLGRARAR